MNPLVLNGAGADNTIIQAAGRADVATFSVFFIGGGTNVTIFGVTIRYGTGGIVNLGTLTLADSIVTLNTADHGGGIWNQEGTLTMIGSTLSGNAANAMGGGLENREGMVTLMDSTVSANMADDSGGGIFNNGIMTATNTTITENIAVSGGVATSYGAGIMNDGELILTNSTVTGNRADRRRASPPLPEPKRMSGTASLLITGRTATVSPSAEEP